MSELHTRPAALPLHERLCADENIRPDQYPLRGSNNYISSPILPSYHNHDSTDWQTQQTPASMSEHHRRTVYDVSPVKSGEGYQTRPDAHRGPPREQLPSLSSILAASRPSLSSRSQYGDQSPTFSAVSPQQARHNSAPIAQDPQPWDSYSQRRPPPPTVPSPYPYDSRVIQPPMSELPQQPLRPMQYNQAPNSPRFYDSRYSPKDGSHSQLPPSRIGWSPRSDPPYQEYSSVVSRDTSSSFRPSSDQHRLPPVTLQRKESPIPSSYRERPHSASSTPQYVPVPANSGPSDTTATKDGLGPKIWTGTQFLPRFVRQAEVPGEGLCYFYDDGTHCKTHIDGEAVNAHWGVTKAGKPRKRLAIACITCREKKIKCDPDYPRCTQCEKFGRVCKFKNAPRGGQGSPDISPEEEDTLIRPLSQLSDAEISRLDKGDSSNGVPHQASRRHPSADSDENPAKRAKYSQIPPMRGDHEQDLYRVDSLPTQWASPANRRPSDEAMIRWNMNPFDTDEELVVELMRTFFLHNGISGAHCILPEKPFMLWLTNRCFQKSPDDLMLIYSILAMATVFSSNPVHKERGKDFSAVSRFACDQRHYSLQLVQSRLLLALYYYATNNAGDSWDFCGSAMRAATGMKLNIELDEIEEEDDTHDFPYNLSRHGYAECRRRTFWTCYILDKFNGFCSGQTSVMHPDDVFIRLPCDEKSFEDQLEVRNPYFSHSRKIQEQLSTVGALAYLINITSIWGDVMAHIYRLSHRPHEDKEDFAQFMSFYSSITARLDGWRSSLPCHLSYSPENLTKSADDRSLNTFVSMHGLYHSTQMRLNRHVRPDSTPSDQLEKHIRIAHSHAEALLLMADKLAARRTRPSIGSSSSEAIIPFSAPFIAYAIVSAVDIVSAKGYLSSLPYFPSKTRGAMAVVTELAKYWHSAKNQRDMLVARSADLIAGPAGWTGYFGSRNFSVVNKDGVHGDEGKEGDGGGPRTLGRNQGGGKGTYEMKIAIERSLARDNDCFYAVGMEIWDRALTKQVVSPCT